jgi:hypothetical protein
MKTSGGRILLLGIGPNTAALHSDLQTAIQDQLRDAPPPSAPKGVIAGTGVGVARGKRSTKHRHRDRRRGVARIRPAVSGGVGGIAILSKT